MLGLNQTLDKFYSKNATPQRDPVSYTKLFNYVTEVVKKVGEIAPQFKPKELVLVGSSASDVSAIRAQEMDRLLLIDIKGKVENIDRLHEFAKLKVDSSVQAVWKECINEEGYLEPRKVSTMFKKIVDKATRLVNDEYQSGYSGITDPANQIEIGDGCSVALAISGSFGPANCAFGNTKCDLVLEIDCEGIPPTRLASWLENKDKKNEQWPAFETVETIRNGNGYGLVAKTLHGGIKKHIDSYDASLLWQYSVSRAESCLLKNCNDQLTYKKLLVILKAVRTYEIPEKRLSETPVLSSYHMKTIFLHEAHAHPDPKDWHESKLAERFVSAFNRLLVNIKEGKLPHFFFPDVNLFKGGQDVMIGNIT